MADAEHISRKKEAPAGRQAREDKDIPRTGPSLQLSPASLLITMATSQFLYNRIPLVGSNVKIKSSLFLEGTH